ncbi:hypothetical protein PG_1979 [Porphyromonas gingivalis W83]|uniref:Uncharacterized protein n=1 Tax=Porphyromonas gingivalis (strain ATCC BAA-308 / W83) TaxID=242619 RepID=Q7MTI0_PORGI|nr:hypothetical protein PG_1979 [Porphyromonas gingivalis W83]
MCDFSFKTGQKYGETGTFSAKSLGQSSDFPPLSFFRRRFHAYTAPIDNFFGANPF